MGLLPYYYDKIIYEAHLENPVDFDNITNTFSCQILYSKRFI